MEVENLSLRFPEGCTYPGSWKEPRALNEKKDAADTASSIITGKRPMLQVPAPATASAPHADPGAVEARVVAYYYAGLTNLFCQMSLPPIPQVKENDVIGTIMDTSFADFQMLDTWLGALDPKEIGGTPSAHLYLEVRDSWRHQIKDWATISKTSQNAG